MLSLQLLLVIATIGAYTLYWYRCFAFNLREAKKSGIPHTIVPVFLFNRFWLVTYPIWLKLVKKLPRDWASYFDLTYPNWVWEYNYAPFRRLHSDSFLTVSPGGNTFFTADPSVITQITTRYLPICRTRLDWLIDPPDAMNSLNPYGYTNPSIFLAEMLSPPKARHGAPIENWSAPLLQKGTTIWFGKRRSSKPKTCSQRGLGAKDKAISPFTGSWTTPCASACTSSAELVSANV